MKNDWRMAALAAAALALVPLSLVVSELPLSAQGSRPAPGSARDSAPAVRARAIEPGTDITPKISDPNRVKTILKLIEDIYYGRPLQYPKDGVVFKNKEGLLPAKPDGFYREYTVMPPAGSPRNITVGDRVFSIQPANGTRGAERLVIGGAELPYYSPNHYKTFILLTIVR